MISRERPGRAGRRVRNTSVVVAVMGVLIASLAVAAPDPSDVQVDTSAISATVPAGSSAPSSIGAQPIEVPLITGDRVALSRKNGAYQVDVTHQSARRAGLTASFDTETSPDGVYVIPRDIIPAIASGQLDRELFDVKYLAENGFGQSNQLPVIVQYPPGRSMASSRTTSDALPASTVTATLTSIHSVAMSLGVAQLGEFWDAVQPVSTTSRSGSGQALGAGITKIWLDRKVKADLAESVPLIGAPQAWSMGHDGSGVRVAVLDTGIDADHPDVAGKVVASRSFIPGQSVADGHGHGTHVAATIAGSGDGSGGQRKGVAPGASLVVGKALSDAGSGSDSEVIAAMEWAAIEEAADIVSMSLGAEPTDGQDPLSSAVDTLTASTGALFVIAAGNSGPAPSTIGTPGAAAAALTVAATDKSDRVAAFSSRGPRVDGAMKPDIAAPGVQIVAARAAGTSLGTPVDDKYTAASGTSMATPHVAGAAAIVAQKLPDLTAAELKAALMSTAKDVGGTVDEVGAGRLDIARGATQQVLAKTPNVDFGEIVGGAPDPVNKAVTYSNVSTEPVTLTLTPTLRSINGTPAPAGALNVPAAVTVPAGGDATIDVNLDPSVLTAGRYSGNVLASGSGDLRLVTPVGLSTGQSRITVKLTPRTIGADRWPWQRRQCSTIRLVGVDGSDDGTVRRREICADGRAPEGSVTFVGFDGTYYAAAGSAWSSSNVPQQAYLIKPQVEVRGHTTIELAADDAEKVSVSTPQPTEPAEQILTWQRTTAAGTSVAFSGQGYVGDSNTLTSRRPFVGWITPTEKVTKGRFHLSTHWMMVPPRVTMSVRYPRQSKLQALHPFAPVPTFATIEGTPFTGTSTREVVYGGRGTADDFLRIDARDRFVLLRLEDPDRLSPLSADQLKRAIAAGARGVLFHSEGQTIDWAVNLHDGPRSPDWPKVPFAALPAAEADRLIEGMADGPVEVTVAANPSGDRSPYGNHGYIYSLKPYESGQIPRTMNYRFTDKNLARMNAKVHNEEHRGFTFQLYHQRPLDPVLLGVQTHPRAISGPRALSIFFDTLHADSLHYASLDLDPFALWDGRPRVERYKFPEGGYFVWPGPTSRDVHWNTPLLTPGVPSAQVGNWVIDDVCTGCRQADWFYPWLHLRTGAQHGGAESHLVAGVQVAEGLPLALRGCQPPACTLRLFKANGDEISPVVRGPN